MNEIVAVLGANKVYGRHLIPRLVAKGYSVRELVRRSEAAAFAQTCSVEVHAADIFCRESLCRAMDTIMVPWYVLPRWRTRQLRLSTNSR